MGKASSSKKVARAAGTGGGRTARGRTPWTFYGVILLVVVLGLVGTVASRDRRATQINTSGNNTPPAVGSTNNAAFAVDICGTLQPNVKVSKDPVGLTTQGDGIIHIHPYKATAAGKNATLGLFASSVGIKLNASELQLPGGKLYIDGDKCEGQAGHVYVRHYAFPQATQASGTLETSDPQTIHLEDGSMYTLAFVPSAEKKKIPLPPVSVIKTLVGLEAAATAATSTTTGSPSPARPTSIPGSPPASPPPASPPSVPGSSSPPPPATPPTTAQAPVSPPTTKP